MSPVTVTPRSVEELEAAVAHHAALGHRIRAVGSQRSLGALGASDGVTVKTHQLDGELPTGPLRGDRDRSQWVRFGCGCTVREAQRRLFERGRMLANTPAFTGQTLAGAVSTASHGTGARFGPLGDLVASLDLVVASGERLRVEPADGPTDPHRYDGPLIQEDDVFHAALVGLGGFGVHASYLLRTEPLIHLAERRVLLPLDEAMRGLVDSEARHASVLVHPYASEGTHLAQLVERWAVEVRPAWRTSRHPLIPTLAARLRMVDPILGWALRRPERRVPAVIDQILRRSARGRARGPAPSIIDLHPMNQTTRVHAIEASVPIAHVGAAVASVLRVAAREACEGRWLTAPIPVRRVAASPSLLAPTYRRDAGVVEVISLVDGPSGREALRPHAEALDALGGRPHLGLDVWTIGHASDLARLYPSFQTWRDALAALDPRGVFDNPVFDRLQIRTAPTRRAQGGLA